MRMLVHNRTGGMRHDRAHAKPPGLSEHDVSRRSCAGTCSCPAMFEPVTSKKVAPGPSVDVVVDAGRRRQQRMACFLCGPEAR